MHNIRLYKIKNNLKNFINDFLYFINIPSFISSYTNQFFPKKNQIIKIKKLVLDNDYFYHKIQSQQKITTPIQESLNNITPTEFQKINIIFPETFILKTKKIRILSDGLVITNKHKIIADFFNQMGPELIHHSIFTKWKLPRITNIPGITAIIVDKQSNCYFHWMFDVLPRLIMLKNYNSKINQYLFYSLEQSFQNETLDILKINKNNIIQANKNSYFEIEESLIPSLPGTSGIVPLKSIELLRSNLIPQNLNKNIKYKKIYISRIKAKSRKILNEKKIIKILKNLGFTAINMEDYSIAEQILIAHSAEIIISPHGSGLANIIFCEPGTKILEIFSASYINTCYKNIAFHCHLDYNYLIETPMRSINDDIIINPNELIASLKKYFNM